MNPKISVILPVYNGELYIKEAVDSILNQTFRDFELIIINDASTDNSNNIIEKFNDSRIKYIVNTENLGLIGTLNKGFSLAKGEYIARMDADDISIPKRFEIQIKFLEKNLDYIICSSSRYVFNDINSKISIEKLPSGHNSILIQSIFNSPFTHPAVMLRSSALLKLDLMFNSNFKFAEDYELWVRLLMVGKGYNFPTPLVYYRDVGNSQTKIGQSQVEKRKQIINSIQNLVLKNFFDIHLNEKESDLLYHLSLSSLIQNLDFKIYSIDEIINLLNLLYKKIKSKGMGKDALKVIGKVYLKVLYYNKNKLKTSELFKMVNLKLFYYGLNF